MKITFLNFRSCHAFGFVLVLFTTVSAAGAPYPVPKTCGNLELELQYYMQNPPDAPGHYGPNWNHLADPSFSNWGKGGSLNLPVATAIIGLYRFPTAIMVRGKDVEASAPYQITYLNWWIWFLANQTGQPSPRSFMPSGFVPPPVDHPNLHYFTGNELFSDVYEPPVVTCVVAARAWAYKHQSIPGAASLITLSEQFLRAKWVVYALAAGYGPVEKYVMPGHTAILAPAAPGVNPPTYYSNAPDYNQHTHQAGLIYGGHFLALAGARFRVDQFWDNDDLFPLFDRAIQWRRQFPGSQEGNNQSGILAPLEQAWVSPTTGPQAGENLYGLRSSEISQLTGLIQNDDTSNIPMFVTWLHNFRMDMTYRILGWPGCRASGMEKNLDGNSTNMFGVAWKAGAAAPAPYDPAAATGTFLYPWYLLHSTGTNGSCQLGNGIMTAYNGLPAPRPGGPPNPPSPVSMTLPTGRPSFHLVLSKGADAYLDTTSPSTWPPPPPADPKAGMYPDPEVTQANTAFGGDVAWVFDSLPDGAISAGENEQWNWMSAAADPNANLDSESELEHRSTLVPGAEHQHYFYQATQTLTINTGESLYAYIYLDPINPPSEVMLQWQEPSTGFEHRAFWGADQLGWGISGQRSRFYMGALPPAGQWVRLEVPASTVGLEGYTLTGMAFSLFGGQATWSEAGKNIYGYMP